VYVVAAWRSAAMKPADADRMARLPLEKE
jgi:hypothetical protein